MIFQRYRTEESRYFNNYFCEKVIFFVVSTAAQNIFMSGVHLDSNSMAPVLGSTLRF